MELHKQIKIARINKNINQAQLAIQMKTTRSTQYLSWINLATFLAIAIIYFAFYIFCFNCF